MKESGAGTRCRGRDRATPTLDREQTFVEHYLTTLNGTRAAVAAGYSESSAAQEAHRLLRKPNVRAQIDQRRREAMAKLATSREHLLAELASIAFYDVRRLMHEYGRWKLPHELDDATAAAIHSVRFVSREDERGRTVVEPLYIPFDKNAAAEKLARHLGLYEKDNNQRVDGLLAQFIGAFGQAGKMRARSLDEKVRTIEHATGGGSGQAVGGIRVLQTGVCP